MKSAVITTGGKQYIVSEGMQITVEKLDLEPGSKVKFPVLARFEEAGSLELAPELKVEAEATVIDTKKDKKVTVIKYHNKVRYSKKVGHRQQITTVEINKI